MAWLKLSADPVGIGFFYGWAERNGERVRVEVLPSKHLWRSDDKGHSGDRGGHHQRYGAARIGVCADGRLSDGRA
jgi:hypothetical protein